MHYQGYDISSAQALIPKLQHLLQAFRSAGFPVYHTREGKSAYQPHGSGSSCLPNPSNSNPLQATDQTYLLSPVVRLIVRATTLLASGLAPPARWAVC